MNTYNFQIQEDFTKDDISNIQKLILDPAVKEELAVYLRLCEADTDLEEIEHKEVMDSSLNVC